MGHGLKGDGDYVAGHITCIDRSIINLKNEYQGLQEELKTFPDGQLVIRRKDDGVFFSVRQGNRENGLPKDTETADKYLRKSYVLARIADLKESGIRMARARKILVSGRYARDFLKVHGSYECGIPVTGRAGKVLKRYSDMGLDIRKIALNKVQYDWINQKFETNGAFPEAKQYKTVGGVFVRSKSELFIANQLEARGIQYQYEPIIVIDGKQYAPDFLIRLPDGREIIWEHFGMTDDPEYAVHCFEKLQAYTAAGYVIGVNLYVTLESDIRMGNVETFIDAIVRG